MQRKLAASPLCASRAMRATPPQGSYQLLFARACVSYQTPAWRTLALPRESRQNDRHQARLCSLSVSRAFLSISTRRHEQLKATVARGVRGTATAPTRDHVHTVAQALQRVLAAANGRGVTRAHVTQALLPLLLSLEPTATSGADGRQHTPDTASPSSSRTGTADRTIDASRTTLLEAAWRASSPHFYWRASAANEPDAPPTAVPCDWRTVIAQTALALPTEGATEARFVEILLDALDTAESTRGTRERGVRQPPACEVPSSLEGARGSLAQWVTHHFADLVLVTRSVRTGEHLYRCTLPQRWHITATCGLPLTAPGPVSATTPTLRGPEYHQLCCVHRALEAVHGDGAATVPVWTAVRDLAPHIPSSMPCPPVDHPHAWCDLLSLPALRPHLALRTSVGVRARCAADTTAQEPPHAATDTEDAAGRVMAPEYLCLDLTSFLPESSPTAWRPAAEAAVRVTEEFVRSDGAACDEGEKTSRPPMLVIVLHPRGANSTEVEQRLLTLVRARWPNTAASALSAEVATDGFLAAEHVLGAVLSRQRTHAVTARASTAPTVVVVCRENKVPAMRAVLAALPGNVSFCTPASTDGSET